MRTMRFLEAGFAISVIVLAFSFLSAEEKTVTLPKGTKVEKSGPGSFKFILPDGKTVDVRNLNARSGIIGDCGIYEKGGKLVGQGKAGRISSSQKGKAVTLPPGTEYVVIDDEVTWLKNVQKLGKSDYILIDDEITWLPATIQFQEEIQTPKSPPPVLLDPPMRKLSR